MHTLTPQPHPSGRALKVIAVSDTQSSEHESQGYTLKTDAAVAGPFATRDLPPFSMMTAKMVTGLTPEQLSVTYWAPGAYLIAYSACLVNLTMADHMLLPV